MITVMRCVTGVVCAAAVLAPAGGAMAHDAATSLVFTRTEPDRAPRTVTLTCDPVGGSHPDAAGACDYLSGAELTLPDSDATVRCIRYYPVELRAHGTLHGTPVSVERTYGCRVPDLPAPWQF
ncbi:subtilisin inhibitor-like domain-containing protein [Nocardia nova SH22a]|uniref:Subtilisin inhibitor-like domain-containing protein n=1 Tax=Nocardia nova SH22a TaxID=1415166 RepID=W5TA47_9NOCA|nr:SSI family serine proteinase inhibitor [Nocardia nova]AHH16077.1 subtilisin inhibitor-like domain-containing protein [Nocardia nova SH22a]